jgi:hypothetical protein
MGEMIALSLLIAGVFSFLFAELFAWTDFQFISVYRKSPKHWTRWFVRVIVLSLSACVISSKILSVYSAPYILVFEGAVFWLWFEYSLNEKRKLGPYYIGKNAFWDRKFREWNISGERLMDIKIVLLSFSILSVVFYKELNIIFSKLITIICQLISYMV